VSNKTHANYSKLIYFLDIFLKQITLQNLAKYFKIVISVAKF